MFIKFIVDKKLPVILYFLIKKGDDKLDQRS